MYIDAIKRKTRFCFLLEWRFIILTRQQISFGVWFSKKILKDR